jgi:hypothetical protein
METIKLITRTGDDGVLTLNLPQNLSNREVEVVIVVQPVESPEVDELGWPIGFFERTYGALADDPIDRGEELPVDIQ